MSALGVPLVYPGCTCADEVYWSALRCGVDTLLWGGTAIMNHLRVPQGRPLVCPRFACEWP